MWRVEKLGCLTGDERPSWLPYTLGLVFISLLPTREGRLGRLDLWGTADLGETAAGLAGVDDAADGDVAEALLVLPTVPPSVGDIGHFSGHISGPGPGQSLLQGSFLI